MDTLFETNYPNRQPLRKYEPLIRFDVDGKPQPRRQLENAPKVVNAAPPLPKPKLEPQPVAEEPAPTESVHPPKPNADLKRKQSSSPPPVAARKKQTSIMKFFKKN